MTLTRTLEKSHIPNNNLILVDIAKDALEGEVEDKVGDLVEKRGEECVHSDHHAEVAKLMDLVYITLRRVKVNSSFLLLQSKDTREARAVRQDLGLLLFDDASLRPLVKKADIEASNRGRTDDGLGGLGVGYFGSRSTNHARSEDSFGPEGLGDEGRFRGRVVGVRVRLPKDDVDLADVGIGRCVHDHTGGAFSPSDTATDGMVVLDMG